jgi:hypothetical protein
MASDGTPEDRRIGENVRVLRGELSQQAVADAMRERGWKWSQATVWSVEKGERPLRLAEAEALAHVLKAPTVASLLSPPEEAYREIALRRTATAYQAIVSATREFLEARDELGADEIRVGGQVAPRVWITETIRRWLENEHGPEDAVAEARLDYEIAVDAERRRSEGPDVAGEGHDG